jgi:hypothetical protein
MRTSYLSIRRYWQNTEISVVSISSVQSRILVPPGVRFIWCSSSCWLHTRTTEWCSFQLIDDENKLPFDQKMRMFALLWINMFRWILLVVAHWNNMSMCRHTALLGHNSPCGMSTHGLLCPSRAVCLHTDCCTRVERYVYTRTVVPE